MKELTQQTIETKLTAQKRFFASGQTKDLGFRRKQLNRLKEAIKQYEDQILEALYKDLHKSKEEAFLTEISLVQSELNYHIKNVKRWSKPQTIKSPLSLFPSRSKIRYEPLGVALIIAPWNYPFQLLINPLIGAISSGCCAALKASPNTPHTANVMQEMIEKTFPEEYICFFQGHREVNTLLLEQSFDLIFFTGSPSVGKVVMKAAAEHLTPVVLELGGKSPCIVHKDANIPIAAKRIIWGKTINAGQTCIAPDYLFVHREVKKELVQAIKNALKEMYGEDMKQSPFYARIINDKAMNRLQSLMQEGEIVLGGEVDKEDKFIAPTLIDGILTNHPIMQEEIFGPLLPMMTFDDISEVITYINKQPKPLALYYFGKNKEVINQILHQTQSGGVCINDALMHFANHHLPFGGVGNSGLGKYHGHDSFLAFSNRKSVVYTPTCIDLFLRYAPYKGFSFTKRMIK